MKNLRFIFMLVIIVCLSRNTVNAQITDFVWAKRAGGIDSDYGYSIAADNSGSCVVTGVFKETATFSSTTLISDGERDIFIAKYNASGNLLWAKRAGGIASDNAKRIAIDGSNNSIITGTFSGKATFDSFTLNGSTNGDIFIVKYDASGNVSWAEMTGGSASFFGAAVTTDNEDNIIITGYFKGTVYFGTFMLTSGNNVYNLFVAKYNSDGNATWAKQANVYTSVFGYDVATDGVNNIIVTGVFENSGIFVNTAQKDTIAIGSAGGRDIFIAKYDASGNVFWAKSAGGNSHDQVNSIATDASGNSMLTGEFWNSITFDTITLNATGNRGLSDIFIVKYDPSGNVLWAKNAGGNSGDVGNSIAVDKWGNCVVTGIFNETATFGSIYLESAGFYELFIAKFDGSGNVLWAKRAGGKMSEYGYGVTINNSDDVFATGGFTDEASFGTTTLTSVGYTDIYIAKLGLIYEPIVSTQAATHITETSAKLNGTVNPNGDSTDIFFKWGTTLDCNNTSSSYRTGAYSGTENVSIDITDLTPGTLYYFYIVGTNNWGTCEGNKLNFMTIPSAPTLTAPSNEVTGISLSPTLRWSASKGASTYQLQVATDSNFTTVIFDESGLPETSKEISQLSINTKYYWHVNATNISGTSSWSNTWCFTTTSISPPQQPTLSAPADKSTNVPMNPTLTWNYLTEATSYRLQLSTDSNFSIIITDSVGITGTSVQISGLASNTTYYWRVDAMNTGGTSDWSNTWSFTTSEIAVPNVPMLSSPLDGSIKLSTTTTLIWHVSSGAKSYRLQAAVDLRLKTIIVDDSGLVTLSREIAGLAHNTTYHWRVNASNEAGTSNWSDIWSFTTTPTMVLDTTITFPTYSDPSFYNETDYKIIGLPGENLDELISTIFSGKHGKNWQIYWDNGDATNDLRGYLTEFDFSSKFQLFTGRAFWVINKGPLNINTTIDGVSLNDYGTVSVLLHDGWNLITNPFLSSLNWSIILAFNNINELIWKYEGKNGFNNANIMEPFIGYYFENKSNLDTLKIPYPHVTLNPTSFQKLDMITWKVIIKLTAGEFIDKATWFGVSRYGCTNIDHLDFQKPRAIASVPTVIFNHSEWDPNYSTFATDIRPEFDEMESWDFEIRRVNKQNSQLEFHGIEDIPEHFDVYLIDEGRGKYINLRDQADYNFVGIGDIMKFRVVVGKSEAVRENLNEINLPKQFVLGKNYPNPFNPTTTIPVSVPTSSEMELRIFNILGQKIKTIYKGKVEAGRYLFTWDGNDEAGNRLSSGVYILHLTTDKGIVLTDKMILMR